MTVSKESLAQSNFCVMTSAAALIAGFLQGVSEKCPLILRECLVLSDMVIHQSHVIIFFGIALQLIETAAES